VTKTREALEYAFYKGYEVIRGEVISPVSGNALKINLDSAGYPYFTVRYRSRKEGRHVCKVLVHRLVARQKYGVNLYETNLVIRHLNSDKLDFSQTNLVLGTSQENSLDIPPEDRMKYALNASTNIRKFTDKEMEEIRKMYWEVRSYKKVMEKYNISTKSTLHYIIHHDYKTSV